MKSQLFLAFLCIFAILATNASRTNRDSHKSYHSKRVVKMSQLTPAEEVQSSDALGDGIGRVSILRTHTRHSETLRAWEEFKMSHNKRYESEDEEYRRFQIFVENHRHIEEHNREHAQGRHSYKTSMNEYGDMEHREFVETMNGFKRNYGDSLAKPHGSTFLTPHNVHLPDNVDWRKHGYVTPVKNQGHCGSCWSFSATGALEGQHKRKNGTLISLSEQNLVDCSGSFGNMGCNGGLMDQAFQYVKTNDGIDTETSYPYEAKQERCRFLRADVGADDSGFQDIPQGDEQKLKEAVGTVGPVSVAIDASHRSFQFYDSGIYYEPMCSQTQLDHGVLVVGYGINEDDIDYWLVKNSWGTTWGEEGYIKMARNRDNMCGIATSASFPLV